MLRKPAIPRVLAAIPWMLGALLAGAAGLAAQETEEPGTVVPEAASPAELVCETSCSEVRLRTGQARISWIVTPEAGFTEAPRRLELTVFKDGFERGEYMTLPLYDSGKDVRQEEGEVRGDPSLRAYRIQVTETGVSRDSELLRRLKGADSGQAELFAVVENLEPGLYYTWRMVVEAPAGELVSEEVTCLAPVCPADFVEGGER